MAKKKKRKRVPETKDDFNTYELDSTELLETGTPRRGEVLGLTSDELDDWIAWRDSGIPLRKLYTNKNTRTKTVIDDMNAHMKGFSGFAELLLNRMAGSSALTNDDRNVLNIKERDKTATRRGKIDDKPIVGMTVIGGGQMKVRVRTTTDASRASMHDLADLIECRYVILTENPSPPGPVPPPSGLQIPQPADAPNQALSKKALFEIDFGTTNIGKYVVAFYRWTNITNPANNGPWTLPQIGLIG
jgi:hypothetical protein